MAVFKHLSPVLGGTLLAFSVGAEQTLSVITSAKDAFGTSKENESIGIYDASSVRGFDLSAAGNYQINGHYFVKSSGMSRFFVEQTNIKIGYGAIGSSMPGPSGVVNYQLRYPTAESNSSVRLGLESFTTRTLQAHMQGGTPDSAYGWSVGMGLEQNAGDAQGGLGESMILAGTLNMALSRDHRLQLLFGEYDFRRNSTFVIRLAEDNLALPREIDRQRYLGQDWAQNKGQSRILGGIYDWQVDSQWTIGASLFFSEDDDNQSFTQVFSVLTDSNLVDSLYVAAPKQRYRAWSGELTAAWQPGQSSLPQQLMLIARARLTTNHIGGERVYPLDRTVLGERPGVYQAPTFDNFTHDGLDEVEQYGLGLAYQVRLGQLQIGAGILVNQYDKRFEKLTEQHEEGLDPWIYNWNLLYPMSRRLSLYGSYAKGLEESGIAPASAANPNEVIPASLASQYDAGIQYQLTDKTKILAGLFRTTKSYAGLNNQNNEFGLLGEVTHKGLEISLSGEVQQGVNLVVGGVYTQAELAGDGPEGGHLGRHPVAVPKVKLIANLQFSPSDALTLDAGIEHLGPRYLSGRLDPISHQQKQTPSATRVNAGFTYQLPTEGPGSRIRLQILNLFDEFHYDVSSSETLTYSEPRTIRLLWDYLF
ncbi:TonB-dependent siderophore receptor [Bowmanella dokdonensis]|uniref:TonB-dependent receptor n=1 Tax=Bowmanella dokdonensis TaxID=751969 RepID=A0A939DNC4_9ALTE|nr:hypothetical protein [Bowmanella dokdonensis]MBN7825683.1 hypothetical protein [Bowmanella dokdonensis]